MKAKFGLQSAETRLSFQWIENHQKTDERRKFRRFVVCPFEVNYGNHPKVRNGFKFGDPSHNIFKVQEKKRDVIVRWKIRNKKTGQMVDWDERGRYDAVWVSTAAHGSTILWKHFADYITATGVKPYK